MEKSWQVHLMDQIYSHASKTFIYVGPSSRFSEEAVRSFSAHGCLALQRGILDLHDGHDANDTFEFGYERWTWGPQESQGGQLIDEIIQRIETPGVSPLEMLQSLMQRPWWSRIWVLQELLLSPNPIFVCGQQTISARVFVASLRLYEAALVVYSERLLLQPRHDLFSRLYSKRISNVTRTFHDMADVPALVLYTTQLRQITRSRYHGIEEPHFALGNLWDLVQDITTSTQRLDASDPRDRIYALIGIARLSRVDPVGIQPDYTLSCTDVYVKATNLFMQCTGPRLLVMAALNRSRTSLSTLPSWAVDWSLNDLAVTLEPPADNPDPRQFELSRTVTNNYILRSAVQDFGGIELIDIEYPALDVTKSFWDNSPKEEALNTIARMSKYLSDTNADLAIRFPAVNRRRKFLERLTYVMVCNSLPYDIETESAIYTLSEIQTATSILHEQLTIMSESEPHSFQDMRDLATRVFIGSCLGMGGLVFTDCPTIDETEIDPEANIIMFILGCVRKTAHEGATPFIFNGELVGTGTRAMRNGDVVVGYEKERLRFVVRSVHNGLYELIGNACVPQLDFEQSNVSHGKGSIISLC